MTNVPNFWRSVFAVLLLCILPSAALAEGGYLADVDDMPLMAGLSETGDSGIIFDKPGGRIVRAVPPPPPP
ncbi:MAG: hypothetical protein KF899_13750, partial [Parvibaculum sp.]|nr:hypothetical protein [Parvibaculum sp.]